MSVRIAILVVLLTGLSACNSNPSASSGNPPAPASPSARTSAELTAVADQIFPYSAESKIYRVCGANGDTSACPMTERLKARLMALKITLCRCQNLSTTREITTESRPTGGVAHVKLYEGRLGFDLIIVNVAGKLLVDDEECLGKGPSTSIYTTSNC